MSEQYVSTKIKEALEISANDKHAAQKLVVTWAVRDPTLLLGLAKPHLKAIISARIDHALRGPKKGEEGPSRLSKRDIDALILTKPLGEKRSGPAVPPPKSSARQASAIQQLVAAFKRKKGA
jgi:hypothetical protein